MIKELLILFITLFSFSLGAQTAEICEGDRLVAPIFTEVQVTESVQFGVGTSVLNQEFDLLMDIYEPVGDVLESRPVVVLAHGGSFISGDRKNPVMVETCTALAERGYVAASIEYTLWPFLSLGLPDSVDLINVITLAMGDLKTAVRFFNEDGLNGNVYGVNPGLISVGGYSAGSIIACHQGMLDESDEVTEFVQTSIDRAGGFGNLGTRLEYSDEIISVINLSGSIYDLDFIDENSTPIYSAHGNMDGTVPFNFGLTGGIMNSNGSGNIHPRYESLGLESELFVFEGGGHTDIFTSSQFADDVQDMYAGLFAWNKEQVCSVVSSNENLISTTASIFPNPTDSELNVSIPDHVSESYTIELYSQIGQLMQSSQRFNGPAAQLNLANLPNGMYLAKVTFEDKYSPITKRIVVSK